MNFMSEADFSREENQPAIFASSMILPNKLIDEKKSLDQDTNRNSVFIEGKIHFQLQSPFDNSESVSERNAMQPISPNMQAKKSACFDEVKKNLDFKKSNVNIDICDTDDQNCACINFCSSPNHKKFPFGGHQDILMQKTSAKLYDSNKSKSQDNHGGQPCLIESKKCARTYLEHPIQQNGEALECYSQITDNMAQRSLKTVKFGRSSLDDGFLNKNQFGIPVRRGVGMKNRANSRRVPGLSDKKMVKQTFRYAIVNQRLSAIVGNSIGMVDLNKARAALNSTRLAYRFVFSNSI